MSYLYDFLTTDPKYVPGESQDSYYKRINKRRSIQRLIIRSFPKEFQLLDEHLFAKGFAKSKGNKDGIIYNAIITFTGKYRLAKLMAGYSGDFTEYFNKPTALEWIKLRQFQPIK